MFVLDLEGSVVINKTVEEVFSYMDDIAKEHEWQPYLEDWEQSPDPNQNGGGTVRRYENRYMGRSFTNVYQIVEYEPNKKVMYQSTPEAVVQAEGGTLWEPSNGGTQVTFIFKPELGDFWGYVPKPIVRRIYMRTLNNNMRRLKKVLES
jgi:uncharacterized membrane protein